MTRSVVAAAISVFASAGLSCLSAQWSESRPTAVEPPTDAAFHFIPVLSLPAEPGQSPTPVASVVFADVLAPAGQTEPSPRTEPSPPGKQTLPPPQPSRGRLPDALPSGAPVPSAKPSPHDPPRAQPPAPDPSEAKPSGETAPKAKPAPATRPDAEGSLEVLPDPKGVSAQPGQPIDTGLSVNPLGAAVYANDALPRAPGLLTFDADYMVWMNPGRRPATGISANGPVGTPFTAGAGDTLGDEHLDRHAVAGARFAIGYWLTDNNPWVPGGKIPTLGIESRFFFVGQHAASFTDDRSPSLVRPFFDLNNQVVSGVVVAAPGLASGSLSGRAAERVWGAEMNLWKNLYYNCPGTTCSLEGMIGLRYLNLADDIDIGRTSSFAANPVGFPTYAFLAGNTIVEQESFTTRNQFYGAQVGIRGRLFLDHAIVTGLFQLGVGGTNEEIRIQGTQTRTTPTGQRIVAPGALLALPSNIGTFHMTRFTQVPELGVNIAFPVTNYLTLSVGFTSLYWSRVVHAGNQVDSAVDITRIPSFPGAATAVPTGLNHPGVPFNQSDMWLLGACVSAQVKW